MKTLPIGDFQLPIETGSALLTSIGNRRYR